MNIDSETAEKFLAGRDPQKYIVAVEAPYYTNKVSLVINHPQRGKFIEEHTYKPFVWVKHDVSGLLYGGVKIELQRAMKKYGVKFTKLKTANELNITPDRMANGYRFLATTTQSYNDLQRFFEEGGLKIYNDPNYSRLFFALSPSEQFMIQTGKRLFKGMEDYDDVHRFQFDLETDGLVPEVGEIFQIGMKDNRGWSLILETTGDTLQERRDSERINIGEFFKELIRRGPDIIAGYNSENFDWDYIERRCNRLGVPMSDLAITLNNKVKIRRQEGASLKLGEGSENYTQTHLWGFNVLDISHAVKRAMAINSDIKKWGLKYITKFSEVEKKNRVYVPGNKIFETWKDKVNDYWFCDEDGSWGKITDKNRDILDGNMDIVTGAYIVERYLLDDLWETEKVDAIYNQASFLLSKILPTTYQRSSTMGTAGQWKLLMSAWSYEQNLAIPSFGEKTQFTGGLSRLLRTGYARRVYKLDFAALYPKTQLTWNIFPDLDISHVMKGLLTYIVSTRDEFKFLTGEYKGKVTGLKLQLEGLDPNSAEYEKVKADIVKYSKLKSDADKKQLPLKILANSFFGSYGAPHIFPWGDVPSAERTTCMSRQHLRLMVRFFTEKGLTPLVGDTDGFNFSAPDEIDDYRYTPKCDHWKTKEYEGKGELEGMEALVAEFNELHMKGWMGLDIDDVCDSTINFMRKNYCNLIDGKVKLVGNSIKSKVMPTYIEEFLDIGIPLLLDNKGYEFIQAYYAKVDEIFNYEIPIIKIASKSKVKQTVEGYKAECKTKTKGGTFKARKAHMELIIANDLKPNLGDVIYYVNNATSMSAGDVVVKTDKETKARTVNINCTYIPESQLENNPNLTTEGYNAPKYIRALNKKMASLLVCFDKDIRDTILIDTYKDRKLKEYVLKERAIFTESQCELVSNQPIEEKDQDDIDERLMKMEDKEIKFWISVNEVPYIVDPKDWVEMKADYIERERVRRRDSINAEIELIREESLKLELEDITRLEVYGKLPEEILRVSYLDTATRQFKSIRWDVPLADLDILFNFRKDAETRAKYYSGVLFYHTRDFKKKGKYKFWVEFLEFIADERFEFVSDDIAHKFWIDKAIEMTYDEFFAMTPADKYTHWMTLLDSLGNESVPVIDDISMYDSEDEWGF